MTASVTSVHQSRTNFGRSFIDPMMSIGSAISGVVRRILEDDPAQTSGMQFATTQPVCEQRNSVLVIDASGSMMDDDWPPSRLGAAKEAARAFYSRLANEDPHARVAIVGYGCNAKVYRPLTEAQNTSELGAAIDRIDSLGSTNIRAGLNEAFQILRRAHGTCDVVLLSDGHNTGRNPKPIAKDLKQRAVISCVGIGGSPDAVDEELMKWMASEYPDGSKRYRWIGDKERLVQHFHKLAGRITRG